MSWVLAWTFIYRCLESSRTGNCPSDDSYWIRLLPGDRLLVWNWLVESVADRLNWHLWKLCQSCLESCDDKVSLKKQKWTATFFCLLWNYWVFWWHFFVTWNYWGLRWYWIRICTCIFLKQFESDVNISNTKKLYCQAFESTLLNL